MGQQQLQFDEYRDFKFCSNSKDKTSEHPAAIYESGKIRKIFLLPHCEPSRTMHLCLSITAPRLGLESLVIVPLLSYNARRLATVHCDNPG